MVALKEPRTRRLRVQFVRTAGGWQVVGSSLTVYHQLRTYRSRRVALETARQWWGIRDPRVREEA